MTCRWRFSRLISDGAVPGVSSAMFSSGTLPSWSTAPSAGRSPTPLSRLPAAGAHVHFVLLAAFVVGRHLVAADQQAQRLGRVRRSGRRGPPPSADRAAPTAPACRRSATCRRRRRPAPSAPRRRPRRANFSSFFRSGPLIVNWISAFWLPPPPIVATGRTPGAQVRRRDLRQDVRCAPRSSPRTDRGCRSPTGFSRT